MLIGLNKAMSSETGIWPGRARSQRALDDGSHIRQGLTLQRQARYCAVTAYQFLAQLDALHQIEACV
jgi:hypothetical protein